MSDVINKIGRAVEDSAPVDVLSDAVRSFDAREDAPTLCPDKPSLPEPSALDAHAAAGHQLIPLDGKVPTERAWTKAKPLDVAKAKARMQAGKNVGVRLRATDLVVDVDPRNFDEGDDPFARLKADFALPDLPSVRTGGGGWHFYLHKPAEVAVVNALDRYKGIEFKSLGRQVVAAGSIHPDTGEPYRLDDDPLAMSLSEASKVTEALLDAIRKPFGDRSGQESGELSPDQLAEWLEHIDVADYRDELKWRELMMASHHATGGEGLEEFVAWSTSDPDYADHGEIIRRRWNSLNTKRGGITVRTLIAALPKDMRREAVEATGRSSVEDDFTDIDVEPVKAGKNSPVWSDWVWVADASQFVRRSDGKKYRADQWNSLYARLKPDGSVLNAVWKGNVPIRKFESLVYLPERPEFPDGERGGRYNIWRKAGVEPKPGDVTPFLDHMAHLFPNEEDRNHVLDYLALLVQHPAEKIHFALLICGAQGTGKSWIGRLMARMIGRRNVVWPSNDEVTSRWTVWMEGAQLAIIEELMTLGRREVANRLKPAITETTLRIEEKGRSHYSIPNCLNFLCFTNHEDALPIERGDRRWLVVFSPAERKDEAYYARLFGFLEGDGASFVKHWLLDRKVALNPKGTAAPTSGKEAMRRLSLGDAENHLLELFEEQQPPFEIDLVRLDDLLNAVPIALQGRANLRARVSKLLKDEIGAVKHSRYTKDRRRQNFQLWSVRNHEYWDSIGPAARIDAYMGRYQPTLRIE